MGANMLNLGGKTLANDQYACACARVRQDISNTVFLPYHKLSPWLKQAGVGGYGKGLEPLRCSGYKQLEEKCQSDTVMRED